MYSIECKTTQQYLTTTTCKAKKKLGGIHASRYTYP